MDIQSAAVGNNSAGESVQHGKVFKILVIGETGSGGSLDNLKVAIPTRYLSATEKFPHSEIDISNLIISQTDICNEYGFVDHCTSNRYVFIDTPGMSSTRGIQQDERNMQHIVETIGKLGGLSGIIFIINGSYVGMASNMQNILTRLREHFVLDNVINIVILSNGKQWESSFDLNCLSSWMQQFYPFYMQMSAFCIDPNKLDAHQQKIIQQDWEASMAEIQKTMQLIDSLAPCL